jgi:crossover junction endodeoxyribonuclease RuvC
MAKKKKAQQEQLIRFPEKYYVVAADLSLRRPGFCKFLVTNTADGADLSKAATVCVDNKTSQKSHGQLLDEIMKAFAYFIPDDGIPIYFVREKAFNARGSQNEMGIYKVVGVMDWLLYRLTLEWSELYPVTVKKLITGSGKADKDQVASMLAKWLPDVKYGTDDESDAAAVAISFLIQNGVLKNEEEEEDGCD